MTLEDLQSVLQPWMAQKASSMEMSIGERLRPDVDKGDDYKVVYDVFIEPVELDKVRIEFWLTDAGHVAVGIETHDRVARRLNLKTIRRGFIAGHEPRTVTKAGLEKLLDVVSHGRMIAVVRHMLWLTTSIRIGILQTDRDAMIGAGYQCSDWGLPMSTADNKFVFAQTVNYRPWK